MLDHGFNRRHRNLKIHAAAEWHLKRAGYPIPADPNLIEHDVRCSTVEINETVLGSVIENVESAECDPEVETGDEIKERNGPPLSVTIVRIGVTSPVTGPVVCSSNDRPVGHRQVYRHLRH